MSTRDTPGSVGKPRAATAHGAADLGTRLIVWIWDASGSLVADGRAEAARVQQAALVVGIALTYDYCPTGRAWHARLDAGRLTWTRAAP